MPASYAGGGEGPARTSAGHAAAAAVGTDLAAELFERYHGEVYAYLCSLLREPAWAEDLAQEAFVRVLQARKQLPEVHNPRAWLYRIATNAALNAIKRRRRFAWLPWRAADRAYAAPDLADVIARQGALEAALAGLPPAYRAPLLLSAQYGLSAAEVAEALGLSESAARKRIYRATELFREAFGKGDAR